MAKVFPTGNAAIRFEGDRVEVGDQLAEVDGVSTVGMGIDDICSLFSTASNTTEIELTFLRYTGPMYPAVEEGPYDWEQDLRDNPDGEMVLSGDDQEGRRDQRALYGEQHEGADQQDKGEQKGKGGKERNKDGKKEKRFGWFGRQRRSRRT